MAKLQKATLNGRELLINGENNFYIPSTLKGWVYIIPTHAPLDGLLYTWAQYTPTNNIKM